jgi:hypothetical protein
VRVAAAVRWALGSLIHGHGRRLGAQPNDRERGERDCGYERRKRHHTLRANAATAARSLRGTQGTPLHARRLTALTYFMPLI